MVEVLEPGTVQIRLQEHRAVRNHLRSVHAVALTNLGELATGLATLTALPTGVRGIVTQLSTRYHAKARGRLTARCSVRVPKDLDEAELTAETEIQDESGTVVATVTAHWRTRVEAR